MATNLANGLAQGLNRHRGFSADPTSSLEDFADRLSHLVTPLIMAILIGVTTTNVYFLRPISCHLPTFPSYQFHGFVQSVCWVDGTIGLRDNDTLPNTDADWAKLRDKSDICKRFFIFTLIQVHIKPASKM